MSTIAERVAAGAAFLDEHDPGWWRPDVERAIDLDELDLSRTDECVLGQRCPVEVLAEYISGMAWKKEPGLPDRVLAYHAYTRHLSRLHGSGRTRWACDLGFSAMPEENSWFALTAEWKRVITERRSAP